MPKACPSLPPTAVLNVKHVRWYKTIPPSSAHPFGRSLLANRKIAQWGKNSIPCLCQLFVNFILQGSYECSISDIGTVVFASHSKSPLEAAQSLRVEQICMDSLHSVSNIHEQQHLFIFSCYTYGLFPIQNVWLIPRNIRLLWEEMQLHPMVISQPSYQQSDLKFPTSLKFGLRLLVPNIFISFFLWTVSRSNPKEGILTSETLKSHF